MPWTNPSPYSCQHLDQAGEREHGEQSRVHREHGLAADDHPPQVDAIGDRAADEREAR